MCDAGGGRVSCRVVGGEKEDDVEEEEALVVRMQSGSRLEKRSTGFPQIKTDRGVGC